MKRLILLGLILFLLVPLIMGEKEINSETAVGMTGSTNSNSKPGFIIISTVEDEALTDFVKFKENMYRVKVIQIDEIKDISKGVDLPEQIRNWLKNNVTEQDRYLLLIGEPSGDNYTWNSTGGKLPMRIAYPSGREWDWRLPTDFYYADLDGDWDKDNDLIYGEVEDDEINWRQELIVGRIPTSNSSLVKIILENIIEFETEEKFRESIKRKKACIAMTMRLWEGLKPPTGDLSILGEQLRNLLEANIEVITLYEKEGDYISSFNCTFPLNKENFENSIKNTDITIVSFRTRNIWKDENSNKNIEQKEIKDIEYFDRSLNIETPISLFWLGGAYGADPLWRDSPMNNFLVSGKIITGVGATSLIVIDENWKSLVSGRYAQSFTYLFTSNLVAKGQIVIGEAMFKTFEQYYNLYSPLDEYDYMLLGFEFLGDPTLELRIDTTPPEIKIMPIEDFTNQKKILVKGEVLDSSGIALLSINDEIVEVKNISFEKEITLEEGENKIEIIALDKAGNKAEMKILIVCDTLPPEIEIISPTEDFTNKKKILVKGEVLDSSGIALLSINDEIVEVKNISFEKEITLEEGENKIEIIALDKAGNKAEMKILIVCDTLPPEIVCSIPEKVYTDLLSVKGSVTDKNAIKNFTINKENVSLKENTFQYSLQLSEGNNTIVIEAEDIAGNRTTKTFNVKYIKRSILKLQIGSKTMYVNDSPFEIDVPPIILEGRTLLPIRWVAEPLGAEVGWDGVEKKVTVTLKDTKIELWIGKSIARVNGVDTPIDPDNPKVVPIIKDGRTMLPVRFVAENLGCKVDWDQDTKTVTITYPKD